MMIDGVLPTRTSRMTWSHQHSRKWGSICYTDISRGCYI